MTTNRAADATVRAGIEASGIFGHPPRPNACLPADK